MTTANLLRDSEDEKGDRVRFIELFFDLVREDDDDFPWGLLALICLAGLFGRQRGDRHVHTDTVHTSNRI